MRVAGSFRVPHGHPALTGHFPGYPLVPGSMILELVIATLAVPCRGVPSARFFAPLPPEREVDVSFAPGPEPGTLVFECHCGAQRVCSGRLLADTAP